jgi:hypothetical protein
MLPTTLRLEIPPLQVLHMSLGYHEVACTFDPFLLLILGLAGPKLAYKSQRFDHFLLFVAFGLLIDRE